MILYVGTMSHKLIADIMQYKINLYYERNNYGIFYM